MIPCRSKYVRILFLRKDTDSQLDDPLYKIVVVRKKCFHSQFRL